MGWVSSVSWACARGSEKSYRRRGIDRLGWGEEKGEAIGAKVKRTQKRLLYGAEKVGLRWMVARSLSKNTDNVVGAPV